MPLAASTGRMAGLELVPMLAPPSWKCVVLDVDVAQVHFSDTQSSTAPPCVGRPDGLLEAPTEKLTAESTNHRAKNGCPLQSKRSCDAFGERHMLRHVTKLGSNAFMFSMESVVETLRFLNTDYGSLVERIRSVFPKTKSESARTAVTRRPEFQSSVDGPRLRHT